MSTAGKVQPLAAVAAAVESARRSGKTVALANGVFDLLHVGHVRYLEGARALADILVVAVNDDASARALKGPGRPHVPAAERAELVAALACTDHVLLFAEPDVRTVLRRLRPDLHVKGTDYTADSVPEREGAGVWAAGVASPAIPGHSTTRVRRSCALATVPRPQRNSDIEDHSWAPPRLAERSSARCRGRHGPVRASRRQLRPWSMRRRSVSCIGVRSSSRCGGCASPRSASVLGKRPGWALHRHRGGASGRCCCTVHGRRRGRGQPSRSVAGPGAFLAPPPPLPRRISSPGPQAATIRRPRQAAPRRRERGPETLRRQACLRDQDGMRCRRTIRRASAPSTPRVRKIGSSARSSTLAERGGAAVAARTHAGSGATERRAATQSGQRPARAGTGRP